MLVGDAPVAFLAQTVSWYLVQPYVRGLVTSPVDEWPGATAPVGAVNRAALSAVRQNMRSARFACTT